MADAPCCEDFTSIDALCYGDVVNKSLCLRLHQLVARLFV